MNSTAPSGAVFSCYKYRMKKFPAKPLFFLIAILLLIGAWYYAYPWGTWRYKITVNIETPEGLKSGSAVREVRVIAKPPFAPPDVQPSKDVKGEAVVVDLGERGKLFALIDTDDWQIVTKTFPGHGALTPKGIRYYNSLDNFSAVMPLEAYPRIVAFKDINDPKSVVEPYKVIFGDASANHRERNTAQGVEDNLADVFGQGVKLKNISIEMTDDPVTWGIEKILPWLPNYHSQRFDGDRSSAFAIDAPLANQMGAGYFLIGENE